VLARFLEWNHHACRPLAIGARWLAGTLATKGKRVDDADVRSARVFYPTYTAVLVLTEKVRQLYDTSALTVTLERQVDFDRINNAEDVRLSVSAHRA
jgi:hypothetical protein